MTTEPRTPRFAEIRAAAWAEISRKRARKAMIEALGTTKEEWISFWSAAEIADYVEHVTGQGDHTYADRLGGREALDEDLVRLRTEGSAAVPCCGRSRSTETAI